MGYFAKVTISALQKAVGLAGYKLVLSKTASGPGPSKGLNLNVAAGGDVIPGFKSLDIYTPHYYKSKEQFLAERVEYDLRRDDLPFTDDSVDNIYISHAVEHVENFAVEKFIVEAHRVLKKGGVLRLACPDARFLYAVSQFKNDYWNWRLPSFADPKNYTIDWQAFNHHDMLVRELATPRMRFYNNRIQDKVLPQAELEGLDYETLTETLKSGLEFRPDRSGEHINNWDFARMKALGERAGFAHIIESKYQGSVSAAMQGPQFDKTRPGMSLYVEMIK